MKILLGILLIPFLIIPAFAQTNFQTGSTEQGTLDIKLSYDEIKPDIENKISIDFINPQTKDVQQHVDYTVAVSKDGEYVFGPISLTHTSLGSVKIPISFDLGDGTYSMDINVEGILFQPLPTETASFDIIVGKSQAQTVTSQNNNASTNEGKLQTEIPAWIKNNAGWWADGQIDDDSFVQGIQFLVKQDILKIPPTTQGSSSGSNDIPAWIKNNAGWWADGQIDDDSFVQGIQFLIKEGIMSVQS